MGMHCGRPSDALDEEWMVFRSHVMTAWGALSSACHTFMSATGNSELESRMLDLPDDIQTGVGPRW